MLFHDALLIDGAARITRDGFLVADAHVGRANNVQDYLPGELGMPPKPDGSPYRIFRPEGEVFAADSIASLPHRPITVAHPKDEVTASNWKRLAVGDIGGDVMRDGDVIRVPIKVMDAAGVKAASTTHQQFSLGYKAELDMTPGKFGDAAYDGSMRSIRYNHLALVPAARGGSSLRIVDERPPELRDHQEPKPMKIKIGDAEVEVTDGAAVAVAVGALNATLADAQGKVGTLTTENATLKTSVEAKDGEIVGLNAKLKDAEVTPAKLQQLADARAKVIAGAQHLKPGIVVDGKADTEIRKEAVTAKLGDAAKDMADAAIEGAFAALTKDAKVSDTKPAPLGMPGTFGDIASIRDAARAASLN